VPKFRSCHKAIMVITGRAHCFHICSYICSWTRLIRTRLFRIPRFFELETISLGSLLQSFTIGYFELPLFRTIFRSPCEFEIVAFNCRYIWLRNGLDDTTCAGSFGVIWLHLHPSINTALMGNRRSTQYCLQLVI